MTDGEKRLRVEAAEARRRKEAREEELRARRLARAAARRERRERLQQRLTREVLYAGEGVSSRLADVRSDPKRLAALGLPVAHDAADVAALLGLDLPALRWLTFHRDVAGTTHYRQFRVPKARGGHRTISAPRPRLRAAQQALRRAVLDRLEASEQAQAFVPGRSTLTNARPHVRRDVLVKVDVVDFFGSITFPRVRGWFEALGYSGMAATLMALLATEAERVRIEVDGRASYVATGPRALPQGAPTSPQLTNQIARRLDRRLAGYAEKAGWAYTRYADDLTFSRDFPDRSAIRAEVGRLLGAARAVLEDEGFRLHRDKLAVVRPGRQKRVTGVVVNERPSLPRTDLRRFRAAVHRVGHDGFKDEAERHRMLGYASYVKMVKPALGEQLLASLREVGP